MYIVYYNSTCTDLLFIDWLKIFMAYMASLILLVKPESKVCGNSKIASITWCSFNGENAPISRLLTLFWKNNISIWKQIVGETQKWYEKFQ